MRTQEEIVLRIREKAQESISFQPEVLVSYLEFEAAKEFLTDFTDQLPRMTPKARWDKDGHLGYTRENVLEEARTYMAQYGWPKCQDHRSLSASRTLDKMQAWAWLLGDDDVVEQIISLSETNYAQYGAPVLKFICEHYGWPIPDDEETQRMMQGLPCQAGCEQGCGR